jgi:Putative bacterial sensory transduction regulator
MFALTDAAVAALEQWTEQVARENPIVTNIERDPEVARWYVRVRGEEKLVTTVWFTVRDRSVHVESYFMPWPEENVGETFEYVLRASQRFLGLRMVIGPEDALYFRGEVELSTITGGTGSGFEALDRILGSIYHYSEECFRTAMRIGFATRFVG